MLISMCVISLLAMSACSFEVTTEPEDTVSEDTSSAGSLHSELSSESNGVVISMPDISVSDTTISLPDPDSFAVSSETGSQRASEPNQTNDTKGVGAIDIGYIDVPADFVAFQDTEPNSDLQYSDITGKTIFTINSSKHLGSGSVDVDGAAQAAGQKMQMDGAKDVTGATVKVAGKYDAKQVYGYYPDDDTFLVTDVFEVDGNVIFLTVEFPSDNSDIVKYLDTYRPSSSEAVSSAATSSSEILYSDTSSHEYFSFVG